MSPHCFTRGPSTFHNSKQQNGGEEAVPGPSMALCVFFLGHYRPTILLALPLLWEVLHSLQWPI